MASGRLRRRTDGVAARSVDGETILVDLTRSTYLSLNESGRLLWAALEGGPTLDDLVGILAAEFGLDDDVARRDAEQFVQGCREAGLLID